MAHSSENHTQVLDLNVKLQQQLASLRQVAQKCEFGFGSGLDLGLAGDRGSLIPIYTSINKLSYGPPTTKVIAPPSSGEESEEEIFDQKRPQQDQKPEDKGQPIFHEVVEKLVEAAYYVHVTSIDQVPDGVVPSVMLANIDAGFNSKQLKQRMDMFFQTFATELVLNPQHFRQIEPDYIRILTITTLGNCPTNKVALFQYRTKEQSVKVFNQLQANSVHLINSHQQPMKVLYAFDKRHIAEERWVGIVLRNLPPNCTQESLKKNFSSTEGVKILNIDTLQMVRNQKCALVRVEDIEQAELFCLKWHNFSFNQVKKLKAHIHPYSFTKRLDNMRSHHQMISHQAKQQSAKKDIFNQTYLPPFSTSKDNERLKQKDTQDINLQEHQKPQSTLESLVKTLSSSQVQTQEGQKKIQSLALEQQIVSKVEIVPDAPNMQAVMIPEERHFQTKEVCLLQASQDFEKDQKQIKQHYVQVPQENKVPDQKLPQVVDQVQNQTNVKQPIVEIQLPSSTGLSGLEALLSESLFSKSLQQNQPPPVVQPARGDQFNYLETLLSGANTKTKPAQKPPQKLLPQPNLSKPFVPTRPEVQQLFKPQIIEPQKFPIMYQQPNTIDQNLGVDTKESSDDRVLGRRKVLDSEFESIQRGRMKRQKVVDSSEEESNKSDESSYESNSQEGSGNIYNKRGRGGRKRTIDDENKADSSEPKKRGPGRPPKKSKRRGRKSANSANSSSTSLQVQQVQIQKVQDNAISYQQPVKRGRGRPPKSKPSNAIEQAVFDFNTTKAVIEPSAQL